MSEVGEMPPISEATAKSQGFLKFWRESFVGKALSGVSDVVLGMFHSSGGNQTSI